MPATYTDTIDGLTTSVAVKAPCLVATTAAITLSGEQTIDGISVVEGDRVLVKDQADATSNGIYTCAETTWSRALDFNGNRDVVNGTRIPVTEGDEYAGIMFYCSTSDPIVFGTSSINFLIQAVGENSGTTFETLEALRISDFDGDIAIVTRAVSGGPVVNMELYKDGTGTATTAPNIFSDLAGDIFCNASGVCYKISVLQSVYVEIFGALRDGATVDATAIQLALDYVELIGGGEAILSPGSYNLGTVSINIASKCVLLGRGNFQYGSDSSAVAASCTTLLYSGASYAVNLGDATYNCYGGRAEGFAINGEGAGAGGIRIAGVSGGASVGSTLNNILVNNVTGTGILCGRYSWIGDMTHVNVRNCTTAFYLAAENNRYNLFGCDASTCTTGFLIGDGSAVNQAGISLFGGRAENVSYGVDIASNSRTVNLFGTYIENFTVRGVRKVAGASNLNVIGCDINGTAAAGSHIYVVGGIVNIQGNVFTGSVLNEVDLGASAVYGRVSGNYHASAVTGNRITTPVTGSIIDIQDTTTGVQSIHRAHEFNSGTFTPTWTNLSVGDASINSGQYVEVGDMVAVTVRLKWGSTTSASGAFYVTNLPKTADAVLSSYGTGNALDSGSANYPVNCAVSAGTTNLTPVVLNTAGTYLTQAAISATVPFTWATNDELIMTVVYHK